MAHHPPQGSFQRYTVNTKEKGERKKPPGQGCHTVTCHTTYLRVKLVVIIARGFQRNGRRVRWLPLDRSDMPRNIKSEYKERMKANVKCS